MVRLTLAVSPDVRARMEKLRDETGADSLTEVIRRSLAVYEFLWEREQLEERLIVVDKDDEETPVHFVWA